MNNAPLVKALIPFIIGVLCAIYIGTVNPFYVLVASVPFLLWLLLQLFSPDRLVRYNERWATGVCIYLLLFISGYLLSIVRSEIIDERHFSNVKNPEAFAAVITEVPVEKEKSYKSAFEIIAIRENGKWKSTIGKCLSYFKKDSLSNTIKYGDEIIFTSPAFEVSPPPNPMQFNYKRFLSFRNINHTVYLNPGDWMRIDSHKGNVLIEAAVNLRDRLLAVFRKNKIEGQDYAVLSALILGDEDEINHDTINAFAASGTLHILSVSGMHVGIIFYVFNGALFFMNRKRSLKIIKSVILIFFLGAYAVLTGLSPPVLRSAAMLGLIVLGISLERQNNSFNIIAASALALLCFNPFFIMDVGFQLSYLAVIGIIFLYKKIFSWFYVKNRILREIWNIISVSIAAQLATFPLALFYFHQFPNYFLLSNLVIIPLSTIIIYGGIALLLFAKWSVAALIIGRMVGWCVHTLNWLALWIEHLPHALINKISISVFETYLIYAAILLFIFFFLRKQQKFLLASLGICCTILIIQAFEEGRIREQKQFAVFNIPRQSAINFIDGNKSFLIADTSLTNNESSMLFNIHPCWWYKGITDEIILNKDSLATRTHETSLYMRDHFISFHEKRIAVITGKTPFNLKPGNKIKIDFLILSENPKVKIAELLNVFDVQNIIFDSSNSAYRCNKWEEDCKNLNIKCHSVPKQGAFVIDV